MLQSAVRAPSRFLGWPGWWRTKKASYTHSDRCAGSCRCLHRRMIHSSIPRSICFLLRPRTELHREEAFSCRTTGVVAAAAAGTEGEGGGAMEAAGGAGEARGAEAWACMGGGAWIATLETGDWLRGADVLDFSEGGDGSPQNRDRQSQVGIGLWFRLRWHLIIFDPLTSVLDLLKTSLVLRTSKYFRRS